MHPKTRHSGPPLVGFEPTTMALNTSAVPTDLKAEVTGKELWPHFQNRSSRRLFLKM
jgi:hypothetical protein